MSKVRFYTGGYPVWRIVKIFDEHCIQQDGQETIDFFSHLDHVIGSMFCIEQNECSYGKFVENMTPLGILNLHALFPEEDAE